MALGVMAPWVVVGISALLLTFLFLHDDTRYELRWKLREGQVLRYKSASHTQYPQSTHEVGGTDRFTVEAIDPQGVVTLTYVSETVWAKQMGGGADIDYSSERGDPLPDDDITRGLASTLGTSFRFRMNARGGLIEISGYKEMQERYLEAMESRASRFIAAVGFSLAEEGNPLSPFEFPEKGVPIGESWSRTVALGNGALGSTRTRYVFTLLEVEGDRATILVATEDLGTTPGTLENEYDLEVGVPVTEDKTIHVFSLSRGVLISSTRDLSVKSSIPRGVGFGYTHHDRRRLED